MTTTLRPRRFGLAAVVLAAFVISLSFAVPPAHSATATHDHYKRVIVDNEGLLNYDNTEKQERGDKVDWAASLIFWNNASIDRVKNSGIGPLYDKEGGRQEGKQSDNRANGWDWDEEGDKGRKTTLCPGAPFQPHEARHYRIYAKGEKMGYNIYWGFWVWGTIHFDIDECPPGSASGSVFGYSEVAENQFVADWKNRVGTAAVRDSVALHNNEDYRVEGDHVWANNSLASTFKVK